MPRNFRRRKRPSTRFAKRRTNRFNRRRPMRRTMRRRNNMTRLTHVNNRFATGFPDQMFTKLKYFENNYTWTLAALTSIDNDVFGANAPFDPFIALGGKSALYYATYSQIYQWNRVMACKMVVTINKVTDTNESFIFALLPRPTPSSVFSDIDDVCAQPRVRIARMSPNRVGTSVKLSLYIPIHVILQMTKLQYLAITPGTNYDGTIAGSPAVSAPIDLYFAKTQEALNAAVTFQGTVKFVFYTKFYQRLAHVQLGEDAGEDTLDAGEVAKIVTIGSDTLPY